MSLMNVIIYTSDDDQDLPAYRAAIREATTRESMLPSWTERTAGPREKCAAKIIVNNRVIWRKESGRTFDPDRLIAKLHRELHPDMPRKVKRFIQQGLSFVLALFIAFFPKCPFCWAAWLSSFGLIGANAIPYRPWYIYVSVAMLVMNIWALYLLNRKVSVVPLMFNLAGALIIVINRFTVDSIVMMIMGGLLLLAAAGSSSAPLWMKKSGFRPALTR